jgi:Fur family ferric uptake transcriptional regulator/Fur family peroxide stress response transcriptional regulator
MTPQRRAVLDVLRASADHPTASEVYDRVRAVEPGVGAATVYRALAMLVQTGQAAELTLGGGSGAEEADAPSKYGAAAAAPRKRSARYDAHVDAHDHAVCTRCGRAVDVAAVRPDLARVARATGFEITGYDTQFHGRCPDCRATDR